MPIRMLSDKVSSMIAAGEVVERPASVVKELVENALDAGATEISVEIRGGGVEQIRVADNGCGIPHDEVEIAFQRFATSKLSDASDLDAIPTLGFRGEALPSIASVARVSVVTRHIDEESGTRLEVDEGHIAEKHLQGASHGTVMTVRQLFRNVPARRKFLRTAATETSHIQNMVTRYALAYPEVRFALNTGRSSLLTPGSGNLQEAIAAVYSLNVAEGMLDIAQMDADSYRPEVGGPEVGGMVGKPAFSRANRGYMSFLRQPALGAKPHARLRAGASVSRLLERTALSDGGGQHRARLRRGGCECASVQDGGALPQRRQGVLRDTAGGEADAYGALARA